MINSLPRDSDGRLRPVYSVCSAHRLVIRAALEMAARTGNVALIEATCNQVNQFGGYTGMRPKDFCAFVEQVAADVPDARFVLGGDHLGPNPWRKLPAAVAMTHAEEMVTAYVAAGFHKIHLDASMPCADDPEVLPDATIAARAARLCAAAEAAAVGDHLPIYVIGTEVPKPGGVVGDVSHLRPTSVEAAATALISHQDAWESASLQASWQRVVALVVQPGVEFSDDSVAVYRHEYGEALSQWVLSQKHIVFEAHSTDYQPTSALTELVRDNFRILKVGPGLTFALREVFYALDAIAQVIFPASTRKPLRSALEAIMLDRPEHWLAYFGDGPDAAIKRHFSYSDRIRYYWSEPAAVRAVGELLDELADLAIPETVVSQYLPDLYSQLPKCRAITAGLLINLKLHRALSSYVAACKTAEVK